MRTEWTESAFTGGVGTRRVLRNGSGARNRGHVEGRLFVTFGKWENEQVGKL